MAEGPWLHLPTNGSPQEFFEQARESLRVARESAREREAEEDLRKLLGPDVPDAVRERAAFVLWALLAGQDGRDPDGEPDLREAILDRPGREHPEIWGGAWYELGSFLVFMGDEQAAEIPMRRAIECGHPDVVDQALCNLGITLAAQAGRERDAEVLLREATTVRQDDVFAAIALCHLAMLLTSQAGRESDAEVVLREAIAAATHGIPRNRPMYRDFLPQALCNLGILLASQKGREREAETFLRRAIDAGEPPFASSAAARLESLRSGKRVRRVVVARWGEHPVGTPGNVGPSARGRYP